MFSTCVPVSHKVLCDKLCDKYVKALTLILLCLFIRWVIDMEGASGTLYEGEKFQLLFKFSSRYPFDSPQVQCTLHTLINKP